MIVEQKKVIIDYTNWRQERSKRTITPRIMYWGSTMHHPELQWLLNAFDEDKGVERTFAMKDVHSWTAYER